MMSRTTEWLNSNQNRRYPFVEDSSLDCSAGMRLTDAVLLDCSVVTLTCGQAEMVLEGLTVEATTVDFMFLCGTVPVTVTVPKVAAFPYIAVAQSNGILATFVFGDGCSSVINWANGTYSLLSAPAIQPALIVSRAASQVSSVTAGSVSLISGTIIIDPGYNCDPLISQGSIALIANPGIGAGYYCDSGSDSVVTCGNAWLWFNGQSADDAGNVVIQGGDGISVSSDPLNVNGLLIMPTSDVLGRV